MPSQATYDQRTGAFVIYGNVDDGGTERVLHEARGYAGNGQCKNNPDCEHQRNKGPLPIGRYRVVSIDHPRFAEPVFRLLQLEGPTYGRGGFLIHGDSRKTPGQASQGCIVLGYADRVAIAEYDVAELEVCASLAAEQRVLDLTEGKTGTND